MKVCSARLDDVQAEALERLAKQTGKLPAELLREIVVQGLKDQQGK